MLRTGRRRSFVNYHSVAIDNIKSAIRASGLQNRNVEIVGRFVVTNRGCGRPVPNASADQKFCQIAPDPPQLFWERCCHGIPTLINGLVVLIHISDDLVLQAVCVQGAPWVRVDGSKRYVHGLAVLLEK